MSESRIERLSVRGSTYLTRRFDRIGVGRRIHFASAMTLLGRSDGADAASGASYLEITDFIVRNGSRPAEDLKQLWSCIVFSIAVSNTDDHLRNHGFILEPGGWRLSPAFDINPVPQGAGLSLAIDEDDNSLDFGLALRVAPFFRLSPNESRAIVDSVLASVSPWRERARAFGIARGEQERMAGAFRTG